MSQKKPTFAVLGCGNSGQTFAADITLRGFDVNLAELPDFAGTLHEIEKKGGIELKGTSSNGFAKLNMTTTDPKEAIKGVDIIIIGGSAHAHEPWSKLLMNDFEDGQFILFTSYWGAFRFNKWKKEAGVTTDITPVECNSLLYGARAFAPGDVYCVIKDLIFCAALPAGRTGEFMDLITQVFPVFKAADNIGFTSINNVNPIVHPPLVLLNAGRIESCEGNTWSLYGDGATESVAKIMEAMDNERIALMAKLDLEPLTLKQSMEQLYASHDIHVDTLSELLRTSPITSNKSVAAPTEINTRYINEDIPFVLTAWSELGRQWGVPTPTIDAAIQIASVMCNENYTETGLTLEEIGIEGMTPDDLKAMIN